MGAAGSDFELRISKFELRIAERAVEASIGLTKYLADTGLLA